MLRWAQKITRCESIIQRLSFGVYYRGGVLGGVWAVARGVKVSGCQGGLQSGGEKIFFWMKFGFFISFGVHL